MAVLFCFVFSFFSLCFLLCFFCISCLLLSHTAQRKNSDWPRRNRRCCRLWQAVGKGWWRHSVYNSWYSFNLEKESMSCSKGEIRTFLECGWWRALVSALSRSKPCGVSSKRLQLPVTITRQDAWGFATLKALKIVKVLLQAKKKEKGSVKLCLLRARHDGKKGLTLYFEFCVLKLRFNLPDMPFMSENEETFSGFYYLIKCNFNR